MSCKVGMCRKRAYPTRKEARKGRNRLHGKYEGGKPGALHVYECIKNPGAWHIGHLAPDIVHGNTPRHTYYGPNGIGVIRYHNNKRQRQDHA